MKYINNYILHTGDMTTTNKCLQMGISYLLQKVLDDMPYAEINMSVKLQPKLYNMPGKYKIEICFGNTEEHENIIKYMKMPEDDKPIEAKPVF